MRPRWKKKAGRLWQKEEGKAIKAEWVAEWQALFQTQEFNALRKRLAELSVCEGQ